MFVCVCHWLDYVVETQVYVKDVTCKRVRKGGRWRKLFFLLWKEVLVQDLERKKTMDLYGNTWREAEHTLNFCHQAVLPERVREGGSFFCLNFLFDHGSNWTDKLDKTMSLLKLFWFFSKRCENWIFVRFCELLCIFEPVLAWFWLFSYSSINLRPNPVLFNLYPAFLIKFIQ